MISVDRFYILAKWEPWHFKFIAFYIFWYKIVYGYKKMQILILNLISVLNTEHEDYYNTF